MDELEIKGCVDWDFGTLEDGVKRNIVEMFLDADVAVWVERIGPPMAAVAVFTARGDLRDRAKIERLNVERDLDLDLRVIA